MGWMVAIPAIASVASSVLSKKSEAAPVASQQAAPQQAVAQNSVASVGNQLNGSGGKVMMEIPAEKAGAIANLIATA